MPKLKRILSIDGGGIRGILCGEILNALEKKLQQKIKNPEARLADFFDFFAGTSTGAILIFIYLFPYKDGEIKVHYTAGDAVNLYLQNGKNIFKPNYLTTQILNGKINRDKYSVKGIEVVLDSYFRSLKLSDLIKPCIIPAYDVLKRQAHFFSRAEALIDPSYNFYIKDIARATSAAPGFFAPAQIKSLTGVNYLFVDGGVFAHNPALCAYTEAKQMFDKAVPSDMIFVSIGSGMVARESDIGSKVDISSLSRKIKTKEIMAAGVAEPIDFQLRQIFKDASAQENYYRFNPKLGRASAMMDDVTPLNLRALKDAGEYAAKMLDNNLNTLAERLIEAG